MRCAQYGLLGIIGMMLCAQVSPAALVVHYTFRDSVQDLSGNGNHATIVGGPTFVPGEGSGNALYFNNPIGGLEGTDYLLLPNSSSIANLDATSSTMAIRFKTPDNTTTNGRLMGGLASGKGFNLNYNSSLTSEAHGALFGTNSNLPFGSPGPSNPNAVVTDGDWHWVVVTHDATAKEVKLYVDSTLIDARNYIDLGSMSYNGMAIGRYNGAGNTNYAARLTTVQEFQLYDTSLTPAQVSALSVTPVPEPGIIGLTCLAIMGFLVYQRWN